jgi:hypothetical protein
MLWVRERDEESGSFEVSPIDVAIEGFLNTNPWAVEVLSFFLAGLP